MSNFTHSSVFADNHPTPPLVFISPGKYIQGPNILARVGQYASRLLNSSRSAVLVTPSGEARVGKILSESLQEFKNEFNFCHFGGECTYAEGDSLCEKLQEKQIDCLIAVGGGKLIDMAKLVAHKLKVPLIVCSSLASNDGPCSALSIMYNASGAYVGGEVYPNSPAVVVADTEVIAKSPTRTFVSGMGDALATYYEARTCFDNPKAVSMVNARPTATALALGKLCAETLYEFGVDAACACHDNKVSAALERVVEANTLLSGLGFESGGLAAAHGIAQALTVVKTIEENYMHGEMVSMGLLTMLVLEERADEHEKAARFCARVGLPINFDQLRFDLSDKQSVEAVAEKALSQWFLHNEPFEVTSEKIVAALQAVHLKGKVWAQEEGQVEFDKFH